MVSRVPMPSKTTNSPRPGLRVALCALAVAAITLPTIARADENLLRGPHPFLKDNELSVRVGFGVGLADTWSGARFALDYGYKLDPVAWLDLQINYLQNRCGATACPGFTGSAAEVLGGIRWKFRMAVPVVPYAGAAAGFAFIFPDQTRDSIGLIGRGVIGADYFFFDWLGVGAQAAMTLGYAFYKSTAGVSDVYGVIEFLGGPVFQF